MKQKKMLIISGSPRRAGNISQMLKIAQKVGIDRGYDVHMINLYDKDINFCNGCMECKKTGVCSIKDDIFEIRESLIESNIVILGSPTYFANVPGIVKNMFDRLMSTVMDENKYSIPIGKLSSNQKYILITACDAPKSFNWISRQSSRCLDAMDEFFHISGMKCSAKIALSGTRNVQKIPPKIIKQIKNSIDN